MDFSWYYIKGILILAGIYMLPVLGLSLLTGFTGLFSFGHAGFMAIGAYITAYLMLNTTIPFIIAVLIGGLVSGLISLLIGRLTLSLKGDYFTIATLGFGVAIRLILENIEIFGGARGLPGIPLKTNLITVTVVCIIAIITIKNIIYSKQGRNMIALKEDELASKVVGIDVFKYKMMALFFSAVLAGIGGGLFAGYIGFLQPKIFSLVRSTELTIIVIFGGLSSISGSVIAALILISLPELLREFSTWRLVIYGAMVVLIMIIRPRGLMGGYEITIKNIKNIFKRRYKIKKGGE
ncbi:MAG: branched-chain amino acid ABC transporter permease [Clostridium sp.]